MKMNGVTWNEPNLFERTMYAARRSPYRFKAWLTQRLIRAVVWLVGDTNSVQHAKRELAPSLKDGEDGPNKWMADNLIELLAVFAAQDHSGMSASWCIGSFKALASFEPLGPLTGADDEWIDHGDGYFQNNRCGHVFKEGKDGQPYDTEGRIFREPTGACFTSRDSRVPVTFPYTPKREYVDVPADR